MTQRETKRPYNGSQPHISSYFPFNAQSQQPPSSSSSSYLITDGLSIDTQAPLLPDNVQTNLLSVGMRVRKAVPDGYKTGTEYPGFNLFNESKSAPATPTVETSPRTPGLKTRPRANAGARELMPFCGLLKVGGMNTQQAWGVYSPTHERSWSRYDCHSVDMVPDEDDVPVLSQGSSTGTPNGNKRRCEWDDSGDDEETDVTTEVKLHNPFVFGERPIAVPRRRTGQGVVKRDAPRVFGEDMDFGEAEFLDFGFKGTEVEMGGV